MDSTFRTLLTGGLDPSGSLRHALRAHPPGGRASSRSHLAGDAWQGLRNLSESYREKLLVLIFGSYTWPRFRARVARLGEIRKWVGGRRFLYLSIEKAHPEDGRAAPVSKESDVVFDQPKTFEQRMELAMTFTAKMEVEAPILVHDITSGRHVSHNIHTEGSLAAQEMMFLVNADWGMYKAAAGIPGWGQHPWFAGRRNLGPIAGAKMPPVDTLYKVQPGPVILPSATTADSGGPIDVLRSN